MNQPFRATHPTASSISLSASSQRFVLGAMGNMPIEGFQIRVLNKGANDIWSEPGDSLVTANSTTSMRMLPNSVEVFTVDKMTTHLGVISTGAGNTVDMTPGTCA